MTNSNRKLQDNHLISGESYFLEVPQGSISLEKDFKSFDDSIVWYLNEIFWRNTNLWEKTYHEHYEKSLPEGISYSHKAEFIKKSVDDFLLLIEKLKEENKLPKKIYLLEQGPGTGLFTKGFLDAIKKRSPKIYEIINFILSDSSDEILSICKNNLKSHLKHVSFYLQKFAYDFPNLGKNKILFARHGNFWDQLPCKILIKKEGRIYQVFTKALINNKFCETLSAHHIEVDDLIKSISRHEFEDFLKKHPTIWKPLIENLILATKIHTKEIISNLYHDLPDETYIISSSGVIRNLEGYLDVMDWEKGGYIEVVDLIVPSISSFLKNRLPKKYDGAIGVVVNGAEIKSFLRNQSIFYSQQIIKGVNSVVKIYKHDLNTMLFHKHFVTFAEIAPSREQKVKEHKEKTTKLLSLNADIVAFSDQAGAADKFYPIEEIAQSDLFSNLNGGSIMTNVAVRRKSTETLKKLFNDLAKNSVKNIFILAGDPGLAENSEKLSWKEVIPMVKGKFTVGAVAHPNEEDLKNTENKIKLGAKFLIIQACYDDKLWKTWLSKIIQKKIHLKIPLIPVVIPLVSKRIIEIVDSLPDIPMSKTFKKKMLDVPDDQIKLEGIRMAKEQLKSFKESGIFKGVYIYSKSEEVIKELLNS